MTQAIINTALKVRQMVIQRVTSIPEELFDVQPAAFNNTIRWNVGHIITSLDGLLSIGTKFDSGLPASYPALFKTGTKPADWTETAPSKDELLGYLNAQFKALSELSAQNLEGNLAQPLELGKMRFETVAELMNFCVVHETIHLSTIGCLNKVVSYEQNK